MTDPFREYDGGPRLMKTETCVKCLKRRGYIPFGHVLKGRKKVVALWCGVCIYRSNFCGHWRKEMGLAKE